MKDKNRANENQLAAEPKTTIGGLTIRTSLLKHRLENFTGNAKITLFDTAQANKMYGTWIKKNLREIVNAVQSSEAN